MPHKFNAARRHKFDKAQYRVINWAEYNESLRQRGDLTGSFQVTFPAFDCLSLVVSSGRVNFTRPPLRSMDMLAGCSCIGVFSPGPTFQRSTLT